MDNLETFYRRNELGVKIEYTVIGYLKEKNNYMLYTDFTTDKTNHLGITIYVDKDIDGDYVPVSGDERNNIIKLFNKEAISSKKNRKE